MTAVTISPKFQVVIPRAVRERLHLKPGEKVQVIEYNNRIEFIPLRPMKSLRGIARGIDTDVARDEDRV
ncbi:MAG: AbrB/MazE/SpoVT family DNA-binding domain-containing protein [Phycisphaerae bacterium]|nr:AbrB/MazE/SpoVT family DNA-binding domain-containing protein [Phycisphaerae bacterium]